ncbi:MAG: site-2 protease family protein [Clostridiales Family XIII bacterium]|jgi:Zn-dependent protease|nr:site-2 protease family protein [Clostridiales Family XIII bacterium]
MRWFQRNPILVLFLVLMAANSFRSGQYANFGDFLMSMAIVLPGIVLGITVHEFAHAFSAYRLGDPTPKQMGRVTLNPLAHIDPVGIIALIFVHFGWGKPVVVNPYAFRTHRRLKNIVVDVAGVVTNFVVAFLLMGLLYALLIRGVSAGGIGYQIAYYAVMMNVILMLFNLLPIPPLDGFGILTEIFDLRRFRWYEAFYNNGSIILLVLILFNITSGLLTPGMNAVFGFLANTWGALGGWS